MDMVLYAIRERQYGKFPRLVESPVSCCKAGNTAYLCCGASPSYRSIDENGGLNVTFHESVPETAPYGGELDRYEQ